MNGLQAIRGAAVELPGPEGRIEALLDEPAGEPAGIAVVCHPHPQHGGTMSNKVVYTLASCAARAGYAVLRFNFRGVGRSEGTYDHARGETADALAVVDWLRRRHPRAALALAGFSFGAHVALAAAATARPACLVTVGTPPGGYLDADDPPHPGCPWLAVHGRDDEVVDCERTCAWLAGYRPPPRLEILEGVGHFFHGRLGDLQGLVLPFLQAQAVAP